MPTNPIQIRDRITPATGMPRGGGGAGGLNPWAFLGMGNQPMQGMQYPTMPDEGPANQYLEPFGFHAQQPSQNAFFPEPGTDNFFGRHPMLTRGLEGAMMGAAFTEPSNTPGEGISNVARSIMGIPMFKRQLAAQQISAPFHGADMMATLMQRKAMTEYLAQKPDLEWEKLEQGQQKLDQQNDYNQGRLGNQANRNQSYNILAQAAMNKSKGFGSASAYSRNAELGKRIQGENDRRVAAGQQPMNSLEESMFWSTESAKIAGEQAAATGGTRSRIKTDYGDLPDLDKRDLAEADRKVNDSQAELNKFEDLLNKRRSDPNNLASQMGETAEDKAERSKRQLALQEATKSRDELKSRLNSRRKGNLPEQRKRQGKWNPVTGKYE